jgi:hypothetical protein
MTNSDHAGIRLMPNERNLGGRLQASGPERGRSRTRLTGAANWFITAGDGERSTDRPWRIPFAENSCSQSGGEHTQGVQWR